MRITPEETCCLVVDMQERLMPAMFNEKECIDRSVMLLKGLHILNIPMFISQQYTKGLGMTIPAITEATQTQSYLDKRTFSCYMDEGIRHALKDSGCKNIILIGAETHVCVLQTVIDLAAAGFTPVLVLDCVASRKPYDRETGIRRAEQEGAIVTTAEALLFELTVDSRAPHFKEISNLVK